MAEATPHDRPAAAGPATSPGRRRARCEPSPVDWKNGALLDVLIDHRPMLVDVACGLIGCESLAEDVVHDVFIKLTAFRDQNAVRQPVAYVTRMVHNASVDVVRRQGEESVLHAHDDRAMHAPSPQPCPETALLTRDTLRYVYRALDQLPPASRAAFEMVRLHEETLQSTARALHVSQALVHGMVRDVEKHCVECLDASCRGVGDPTFCDHRARRRRKTSADAVN